MSKGIERIREVKYSSADGCGMGKPLHYNQDKVLGGDELQNVFLLEINHEHTPTQKREPTMSLGKVIEVMAEGETLENAVENAVTMAAKTVEQIRSVYIENIQAIVDGNKVARYRINAKVTFIIKSS